MLFHSLSIPLSLAYTLTLFSSRETALLNDLLVPDVWADLHWLFSWLGCIFLVHLSSCQEGLVGCITCLLEQQLRVLCPFPHYLIDLHKQHCRKCLNSMRREDAMHDAYNACDALLQAAELCVGFVA